MANQYVNKVDLADGTTVIDISDTTATASDVAAARDAGADAVLIGEAVMRAADKKAAFDELRRLL